MTALDPSEIRDQIAKDTATSRTADSDAQYEALSTMVHVMKGDLAANTAFTKMMAEKADAMAVKQEAMVKTQGEIVESVTGMTEKLKSLDVAALTEATGVLVSMKGGMVVLGWLGVFAKWVATISIAVGIFWGIAHWGAPK